jgi:alkaline phosphatase
VIVKTILYLHIMSGYIKIFFGTFCVLLATVASAQYNASRILSHNDYAQAVPFDNAYRHQVGFIEADVFLHKGTLVVAHTRFEIDGDKTLASIYLTKIQDKLAANGGDAYPDRSKVLTLMIDFKTEGSATMEALLKVLEAFPSLVRCKTFRIVISGNVPALDRWLTYPAFIYFDGRPGRQYAAQELERIAFISDDFNKYARSRDVGSLNDEDRHRIESVVASAHQQGKLFRFWGAPDTAESWLSMIRFKVDILGTDRVSDLVAYLTTISPDAPSTR